LITGEGCACRLRGGGHVAEIIDLGTGADIYDIELAAFTRAVTTVASAAEPEERRM